MSFSSVDNVKFASEFATDKIVAVFEGSFSVSGAPLLGGYIAYTSFAHGFNRPVFVKLSSRYDNDGAGTGLTDWSDTTRPVTAYSDGTNIIVGTTRIIGKVYYRIICFWIDDYDTSDPSVPTGTVNTQSQTYFDSRLNYQKVFSQGEISQTGTTDSDTITHNLGYKPNVVVHFESLPGQIWPAHYGGAINPWLYDFANQSECLVKIGTSNLVIETYGGVSAPSRRIFYRVYYDG